MYIYTHREEEREGERESAARRASCTASSPESGYGIRYLILGTPACPYGMAYRRAAKFLQFHTTLKTLHPAHCTLQTTHYTPNSLLPSSLNHCFTSITAGPS